MPRRRKRAKKNKSQPAPAPNPRDDSAPAQDNQHDLHIGLDKFRQDNVLCDVTLKVEGKAFPAHKNVLAVFSPYFKAMFQSQFKEATSDEVSLPTLKEATLQQMLEFAYLGEKPEITFDNVSDLVAAAHLMDIKPFLTEICTFLTNGLATENCIQIYRLATLYQLEELLNRATEYFLSDKNVLAENIDEILELSYEELTKIFVDNGEKLIPSEMSIFELLVKWLDGHGKNNEHAETLLSTIRYHLMSRKELASIVYNPYVVASDKCRQLVERALEFSMAPSNEKPLLSGNILEPRAARKSFVIVASRYAAHPEFDSNVFAIDVNSKKEVVMYPLSPMPEKRRGARGVQVNGYLYVCGGVVEEGEQMDKQCLKTMLRYCSLSNTWQELAPMSVARAYHAVMYKEGKIIVAGGTVQGQHGGERFNWKGEEIYGESEPMPFEKTISCALTSTSSVEEYDISMNTWHRLRDLPQGVCFADSCTLNNEFYIIGGASNSFIYRDYQSIGPDSLWSQDIKQTSDIIYTSPDGHSEWGEISGMCCSNRMGHCTVSSGTEILIVGGAKRLTRIFDNECKIDHVVPGQMRSWNDFPYYQNERNTEEGPESLICKLASPTYRPGATIDNGSLYIVGGHGICKSYEDGGHCCKDLKQSELLQIYDIETKTFTKVRLPFSMNDIVLGHMKLPNVSKLNGKSYGYEELVHKAKDDDLIE